MPEQNGKAAKNKQHLLIGINNKSERERKTEREQDENENWPQTKAHRMTSHLLTANSVTISSMGKVLLQHQVPSASLLRGPLLADLPGPQHRRKLPSAHASAPMSFAACKH